MTRRKDSSSSTEVGHHRDINTEPPPSDLWVRDPRKVVHYPTLEAIWLGKAGVFEICALSSLR
jgi:hypothetical protein